MQRQIRFKRLAVHWELRRVPESLSAKDLTFKESIVIVYTLLLEDPLYAETVLSQRRFTSELSDMPHSVRKDMLGSLQLIEAVIRRSSPTANDLLVTGIAFTPKGVDERMTGHFFVKSSHIQKAQLIDGPTFESNTPQIESDKIRVELSKMDTFFYGYALDHVKDENSRMGIIFEGL